MSTTLSLPARGKSTAASSFGGRTRTPQARLFLFLGVTAPMVLVLWVVILATSQYPITRWVLLVVWAVVTYALFVFTHRRPTMILDPSRQMLLMNFRSDVPFAEVGDVRFIKRREKIRYDRRAFSPEVERTVFEVYVRLDSEALILGQFATEKGALELVDKVRDVIGH